MTHSIDLDELAKLEAAAALVYAKDIDCGVALEEDRKIVALCTDQHCGCRELTAKMFRNAAKSLIERVRTAELLLERTNTYAWPATALMEVDMLCQQRDKHATDLTIARANAKSDAETIAGLRAEVEKTASQRHDFALAYRSAQDSIIKLAAALTDCQIAAKVRALP